ncbi:TetR/AcrR family transcriptional regulator [Shinella sp. YE25]|uniref:TetR/AcrR family transcriptional regulator n=3 Tax=Shinella TaxID=323620 RepID=UPI00234EB7C3|nr:TetR/AcrR family transcriptional regulator [Shinella sp. YE25]CAK7261888.1 TetR family transcriptional regulator [Shinella sp. WSC3-e]
MKASSSRSISAPAPDNREAIMLAAERVFAKDGYDGSSMRDIAKEANVSQALLHYHFGTKEKLFDEIFSFRATEINQERGRHLDRLFADGAIPSLPQLIDALFRPTVELGHDPERFGNFFSRILAASANSDDPHTKALIAEHYDSTALRFISAFQKVLPGISREDAVWAYMFSIGVGMTMMARTGRTARLSNGACDDNDVELLLRKISLFVCGGLLNMAPTGRT